MFGMMDVTLAGLPYLKKRKGSTLVIIGSRSAFRSVVVSSIVPIVRGYQDHLPHTTLSIRALVSLALCSLKV